MNRTKRIISVLIAMTIILATLTSCSKFGKNKDKSDGEIEVPQVEISSAYIYDRVDYETSKNLAERYGISFTDEDLKNYVRENYSGTDNPQTPEELLSSPMAMSSIIGETNFYRSYAHVYVDAQIRSKLVNEAMEMTEEEIEQYKTEYKEYMDSIGIPEQDRAEYVRNLKETLETQQKIEKDREIAKNQAILDIFKEYAPNYLESTGIK